MEVKVMFIAKGNHHLGGDREEQRCLKKDRDIKKSSIKVKIAEDDGQGGICIQCILP